MAHKGVGLKVYIRPGFSKAAAVKKAIGVLNKKLGGEAFTVTKNKAEANVTVRGAKKGSEAMAMGGYAKRIPKGYGEARQGKTKIVLAPKGRPFVSGGRVTVAKTAAHELQHAAGVKHSQMVGGKKGGIKPIAMTGERFTKVSKAKAQRVTGLAPHKGSKSQDRTAARVYVPPSSKVRKRK